MFVDVYRNTFNIDTVKLEKAIQRTLDEGKLTPRSSYRLIYMGFQQTILK